VPTADSIRIDRAAAADIPALIGLLDELFSIEADFSVDAAKQRRGLALLLAQPANRAAIFVARTSDGTAVGMASAQLVISTAEGAPSAWIEDVVVGKSFRGKGVAKLLLQATLRWAAQCGATRAQLLADHGNQPALDFYGHLGWRSTRLGAWRVSLRSGD
jgi:GNAT superfamily N-acetyltransferase